MTTAADIAEENMRLRAQVQRLQRAVAILEDAISLALLGLGTKTNMLREARKQARDVAAGAPG